MNVSDVIYGLCLLLYMMLLFPPPKAAIVNLRTCVLEFLVFLVGMHISIYRRKGSEFCLSFELM